MFLLAAVKVTHDLVKLVHLKVLFPDCSCLNFVLRAIRHQDSILELKLHFCLHFIQPHAAFCPVTITTELGGSFGEFLG